MTNPRYVKWLASDGGWKTGRVVAPDSVEVQRNVLLLSGRMGLEMLVQHSCTGELEFVLDSELEAWPSREEWEG